MDVVDARRSRPSNQLSLSAGLSSLVLLLNLAALYLVCQFALEIRKPLEFDDAFMFQRYALHLRQGLGIGWNLDRVHTGGLTSMGWFLAVLPVSFLPFRQGQPLAAASFVIGLAGIAGSALGVSRLSSSPLLRRSWLVLPSLVLLLTGVPVFRSNMVTGMDTMLSFAVNAALSCSIWAWCIANPGRKWPALVGFLGVCAVIVRPENGLLAVLAPLFAACLLLPRSRRTEVLWAAVTFAAALAIYFAAYRAYFHAWLPLSFYMKSQHPYRGYIGGWKWRPEIYLAQFLVLLALPVLAFPLMCLDRRSLRVALTYLLPLLPTFAYLETVTQIMGSNARYYVPFLAPVLVASFWMADLSLQTAWVETLRRRLRAIAATGLLLLILGLTIKRPLESWSGDHRRVAPYPAPKLLISAASPLPEQPWFRTINLIANGIIRPLPPGVAVAASEVGLIGAAAPQVNVIDLAGLNDNDIALHGFSMERLLDRKPLLIWFPHSDYTSQRHEMFCFPGLLRAYTVIGGDAFNYSLAIRNDAPETPQVMQSVADAFRHLYPGAVMDDYIVSAVRCT